jgi:transposase
MNEPQDWREGRRLRAWQLKQQGWKQKDIARALGVSEGAVSQWMKRADLAGADGLKRRPPPGAQPRLSADQKAQLPTLLARGAEAYGFLGAVWTQARVKQVIKQVFGVDYHRDYIGVLLREIGWSVQKPIQRASQRDEPAIEHWREETWPAIKKKLSRKAGQSSM